MIKPALCFRSNAYTRTEKQAAKGNCSTGKVGTSGKAAKKKFELRQQINQLKQEMNT